MHLKHLVLAALLGLSCCSQKSDWTAFVYPDREKIPSAFDVEGFSRGKYPTFKECQSAAIEALRLSYAQTGVIGDYECGYKCTHRSNLGGLLVCKKDAK
ncbi:MAG: hypothetical protein QM608_02495 [Caulobacter sp.]